MTDLAALGLSVRSDGVVVATDKLDDFKRASDDAGRGADNVSKRSDNLNAAMKRLAGIAGSLVGALGAAFSASAALSSARTFNAALAETGTLLSGSASEMAVVEENARRMSREFGGTATAQVQAYYQAISAGAGDAAAATKLLDTANRLAKGGVTDVTTAVDVLTTATNAYRAAGLTAAEASDALFVGMKAGKTTITELSASVGQVLPVATSLGVTFDETVAAMSALTTQGISTAQAATGVRAALNSMIAPTDEAQKLAAALGIEFNAAGVQANGFGGVMDQVIQKTGGNTEAIQKLFGSIEATTVALSFAGGAGDAYSQIMGQMTEKTGATQQAFDVMASSLNERLNVVLARGTDLLLAMGNIMLAALVPALEAAVSGIDFLVTNSDALAVALATVVATQIPAMIAGLSSMITGFSLATTGATALTGAVKVLSAAVAVAGGPWGILAAAIAAGVGYMVLFRGEAENTKDPINQVESAVKELNAAMGGFIGSSAVSQGESIKNAEGHRIQARAALEAARAEIVLMRAEQQRFASAPIEERGLLGDMEDAALQRNIDAATGQLDALTAQVEEADRRLKAAVGAITGGTATGGRIVVPPAIPGVEFPEFELPDLEVPGGAGGGAGRAKTAVDDLSESLKEAKEATFDLNSSLAQTFTDALTGAKNLQDGIKDLLKSMANLFLNEAFTRVLTGFFPGFSAIPTGIPGRERGGPVQAGRPYIVGERRPELFVPGQSGTIIPHVPAMSSGGGTSVQIINNTGEPVREQRQTGPDGREVVRVIVGEEIAKGGFDRQMGRFGVSPAKVRR